MPFRRNQIRDAAELAYRRVVEQARRPEFFTRLGVPDTLDGRFELICLHAFLFLHRLKGDPAAASVGQRFYDTMFADFDRSLRELGTGDLSVSRQIRCMTEALNGRVHAYEDGLGQDDAVLCAALRRNLYGTTTATPQQLEEVAGYLRQAVAALAAQPTAALLAGRIEFGSP